MSSGTTNEVVCRVILLGGITKGGSILLTPLVPNINSPKPLFGGILVKNKLILERSILVLALGP